MIQVYILYMIFGLFPFRYIPPIHIKLKKINDASYVCYASLTHPSTFFPSAVLPDKHMCVRSKDELRQ